MTGGEDGLERAEARQHRAVQPRQCAQLLHHRRRARPRRAVSCCCALVRSPFGHVLMAIRENQLRATFQGYPVERYKLGVFVISAVVTGLAGALLGFQNYLVSAEAVSVPFSGELLAIVVIGGMHHMLGPALGALFFILFRELFSIWTSNWLLWFGLIFVGFVLYLAGRPGRHLGDALSNAGGRRRKRPPP